MPWRQVFALIVFNRENSWSAFTNVLLIDYILITNLMHWLLFIHKIISSSTCFEPQMLIFRRIQLCTCSIWYCHSLWEFVVACRYTAWVRTDCRGKVVGGCLKTPTNNLPPTAERTQCAQLVSRLHTTAASTSRLTPHAVLYSLFSWRWA